MVDHQQFLGIPKGAPNISFSERRKKNFNFKDFCKAYISIISRWCRIKKSPPTISSDKPDQSESKFQTIQEVPEELGYDSEKEESMNGVHSYRYNGDSMHSNPSSPRDFYKHKSMDSCFPNIPSPLSRSASRKNHPSTPTSLPRSISRKSTDSFNGFPTSLSRSASRASTTTPIMFSNSTGMVKPPAILKNLECTLEELCYGCLKKIKITRDVLTSSGQIIQEEELLTIKVKPGWKKGTKITFEGMGNERPGTVPADITFVIAEKRHHLFRREGDDLEIGVEIPLVKALTGCQISIPLLGGEKMRLTINDIIYPGYEKFITGQGMPNTKEQGRRGNLKVVFLVSFPTELTHEQRSDILSILEDSC